VSPSCGLHGALLVVLHALLLFTTRRRGCWYVIGTSPVGSSRPSDSMHFVTFSSRRKPLQQRHSQDAARFAVTHNARRAYRRRSPGRVRVALAIFCYFSAHHTPRHDFRWRGKGGPAGLGPRNCTRSMRWLMVEVKLRRFSSWPKVKPGSRPRCELVAPIALRANGPRCHIGRTFFSSASRRV
jgi:hypothetical protein